MVAEKFLMGFFPIKKKKSLLVTDQGLQKRLWWGTHMMQKYFLLKCANVWIFLDIPGNFGVFLGFFFKIRYCILLSFFIL